MVKGNISKIRNVLGVSVLALVLAPVVANAAVLKGGNTTDSLTVEASETLSSDMYFTDGSNLTITAATTNEDGDTIDPKDIVVDLNNKTITLTSGSISVNSGANVTIKRGKIVCSTNVSDCVSATSALKLENVTIESAKGNALKVSAAKVDSKAVNTISSSILKAANGKNALTVGNGAGTTLTDGVINGSVTSATADLEVSGTVRAPYAVASYAKTGSTIYLNAAPTVNMDVDGKGIKINLSELKEQAIGTTFANNVDTHNSIIYDKALMKADKNVDGNYEIAYLDADYTAYDEARKAWDAKSDEEKEKIYNAASAIEKTIIDYIENLNKDNQDIRNQKEINEYVTSFVKILNGEEVNELPSTTKPDNSASKDDEPKENPQTFDALLSYVGMALASVGGIAVSLKKSLFR